MQWEVSATIANSGVGLGIATGAGVSRQSKVLMKRAVATKHRSKCIAIIGRITITAKAKKSAKTMGRVAYTLAQSYGNTAIGSCPVITGLYKTNMPIA